MWMNSGNKKLASVVMYQCVVWLDFVMWLFSSVGARSHWQQRWTILCRIGVI